MNKIIKMFREEVIVFPLILLGFYLLNWTLSVLFPNGAFFDFFSIVETLYYSLLKTALGLTIGMLLLWIAFPPVFKKVVYWYHNFEKLSEHEQKIITLILLVLFLLLPALSSKAQANEVRVKLIQKLETQLNVRETGYNTGPEVDIYLRSVGFAPGASWCGAFVAYNLTRIKVKNPNTAWSPAYASQRDIIWTGKKGGVAPMPGDVATFYYPNLRRVGHVGFFVKKDFDGYFITIEGNTNGAGSREGDGVFKKKRESAKIHAITRYIK
jgi:hypothetical protein